MEIIILTIIGMEILNLAPLVCCSGFEYKRICANSCQSVIHYFTQRFAAEIAYFQTVYLKGSTRLVSCDRLHTNPV